MVKRRVRTALILSHLLALGAGAWWSGAFSSLGKSEVEEAADSPREKSPRQYRVSSRQILGAFEFDSPFFPKNRSASPPSDLRSPEEKAAEVVDFRAEMQSHVEVFNQTGHTDYRFTQELIYRWMSLNPKEAMDFFAKVEIRSGWGDPWLALFKNPCAMSGLELATHIDQNWVPYNRGRGLGALAELVGKSDPAQLPSILELLAGKERESSAFLSDALNSAKATDLSIWLELTHRMEASRQKDVIQRLASKVVPSSVPPTWFNPGARTYGRTYPSSRELEELLETSRGTDLEPLIQSRFDSLLALFEKEKKQRAEQAAHTGKPDRTERRSPHQIKYELTGSLERSRTMELRAVVRGEQSAVQALQNHISLIDEKIAEGQRKSSYQRLLTEAMLIDPDATFQFGRERFSKEELEQAFGQTDDENIYSVRARSKMLDQLFETSHWGILSRRGSYLTDTIREYRAHHLEQAAKWARSLPEPVVEEIKNVDFPDQFILKYLEEVRSK